MIAYLFPGQGSQKIGMGKGLFEAFPDLTARASSILGYSVEDLCLRDPDGLLGRTEHTQPALYVVNAIAYLQRTGETGETPRFLAGHSLGEYNALLAAGVFGFEDGLRLVLKRGELMARAQGGGMAAIVGLTPQAVAEVLRENGLESLDVANYNAPRQVVISGRREDVDRARPAFLAAGAESFIPLRVSGAFHSRYMAGAASELSRFLSGVELGEPAIPVVSNVTARFVTRGQIRGLLELQLTSPVRWCDSVRFLLAQGAEDLVEVGPGAVLTRLAQKIRTDREIPVPPPPPLPSPPARRAPVRRLTGESLGSEAFRNDHGLRLAYCAGSLHGEVASRQLVARVARAGCLGFLGTRGVPLQRVAASLRELRAELGGSRAYGINLSHNLLPDLEEDLVDLALRHGVRCVEASLYGQVTPGLVRFRLAGARREAGGAAASRSILVRVSRPEVAEAFMSPPPPVLVERLLQEGKISRDEAEAAPFLPVAQDLCVQADCGGYTDSRSAYALLPALLILRDRMMPRHRYAKAVRVGITGGIGTPGAAAAAFIMGAEFLVTGSVNQCTAEAETSPLVKDMLSGMGVQDTAYAPTEEMAELGARLQVLRKGVLFPARAGRLWELYKRHGSLEEIDPADRRQLEEKYFQASLGEVWESLRRSHLDAVETAKAEASPKVKLWQVFRAYFRQSHEWAVSGREERRVDFQVHCGPAQGAFNQWVRGTDLEDWRGRHADGIAERLMAEAAAVLQGRLESMIGGL